MTATDTCRHKFNKEEGLGRGSLVCSFKALALSDPFRQQGSGELLGPKVLAILAGSLAGVQSVPATLYNQSHVEARPTVVVFPQCLGTLGVRLSNHMPCSFGFYPPTWQHVAGVNQLPSIELVNFSKDLHLFKPHLFDLCRRRVGFGLVHPTFCPLQGRQTVEIL